MKQIFLMALILTFVHVQNIYAMDNDDPLLYKLSFEEFEYQMADEKALSWSGDMSVGYSLNKVYLYSEGEKLEHNKIESENQLLFSHAVSPFMDVQLGVGYDTTSDADYTWGVIALSGMSSYFIELRAALLVSKDENLGLRFEADYEALITQRLVLTPSISTAFYSKDVEKMELGKGLSNLTLGLRLKYVIVREFSPYLGIEWSKNYGNTNDFHKLDESYIVAGVNFWF